MDSSSAMVKESCSLGVTSIRADVRSLPFPSELFDAAIAAWMLYHVSPYLACFAMARGNVAMQGVAHVNARRRTLPHRIQGEKEGLSFRLFHTDHVGINDGGDAHVVTIDAAHRHP